MVVSEILGGARTVSSEGKRKLGMSPERGQPCDRAGARPEALWERSATPGAVMCLSTARVLRLRFQLPPRLRGPVGPECVAGGPLRLWPENVPSHGLTLRSSSHSFGEGATPA